MTTHVTYDLEDGVATITLSRPEKLNALTLEMWETVDDLLTRADRDGARVAVLTGEGRTFCAGDDIATLRDIDDTRAVRELTKIALDCFGAIEDAPLPVVGKANGSAYGGGFELLLACDLTVVPEAAEFALPEVQIGAYPFYGAKRLARMIGRQRAADIALAGRKLSGEEAAEWGLFARAVASDDVDEAVESLVAKLKRGSPPAVETTKAWLNASLKFAGEDDAMRTGLGYLFAGPEAHEGALSFLEKRDPDYVE
ncbi:enoyl-CoA hydratase/isomerase family protein [Haladaptatus sp. DJG-WS-42]|uniref:enoyl-CoA hydratase/isomerase family protein n=1 Tax=Haladaptatus sp. DJG-WS-42 TaxID=3120516 RepID=UPI0030CEAD31